MITANKAELFKQNATSVRQHIAAAAARVGRLPEQIQLVAVTKYLDPQDTPAALAAGLTVMGENRLQQALPKFATVPEGSISWHFIGHLQRNKVRTVIEHFELIHSVDSLSLAAEISKRAQQAGKRQRILLQVNVAGEESKSGCEPTQLAELALQVADLPGVQIEGLMGMAPLLENPEDCRPVFRQVRELAEQLKVEKLPETSWDALSMGMTNDFEVAIEEGATLVRVGSALFHQKA